MRKALFNQIKSLPAGIPNDVIPEVPQVTVKGDGTVIIENHGGLMSLSKDNIEIVRRGGLIRISGNELKLCCMNPETIIVRGNVFSVELV